MTSRPRDPFSEAIHTIKVAVFFFVVASVVFALHFISESLQEHGFSRLIVFPLRILEYAAFVSDVLYLANYLITRIIDLVFEFCVICKRVWIALAGLRRKRGADPVDTKREHDP